MSSFAIYDLVAPYLCISLSAVSVLILCWLVHAMIAMRRRR